MSEVVGSSQGAREKPEGSLSGEDVNFNWGIGGDVDSNRGNAPPKSPKPGGVLRSILEKCKIKKSIPLPPVPLCAMKPTTAVRPIQTRNDIERLKDSVATLGYLEDHQAFFCQPYDMNGEEVLITEEEIKSDWDPHWVAQYMKFEDEIRGTDWDFLIRRRLFVWDGNHRWNEWTMYAEENRDLLSHLRVKTILIDGRGKDILLSIHFTTMNR
ncbi:hypothetical protein R1sor_019387 [Riccia sorocarpa]|uniref:Uncharacterized protein n=1 Tax=Riccia sorocarpa TaxID=122646 RepID=A0ABD3IG05_9MARC